MNRPPRYRPLGPARAVALAAAAALTAVLLAGVATEARHDGPASIDAVFTGEVSASGPVYRLPDVLVRASRPIELALPGLIDRAIAPLGNKPDARPSV